ncbi:MAG: hypothetical protein AABY00_02855 [Nanoarchaeota archaeon]
MPIVGVLSSPHTIIPARAYLHSAGLEVFHPEPQQTAIEYFKQMLEERHRKGRLETIDFVIGILWGNTSSEPHEKMLDLFGYRINSTDPWRTSNPEVHTWTICNGVYVQSTEIACEDGMITLGKEAEYRRSTTSLEAYMRELPPFARELTRLVSQTTK